MYPRRERAGRYRYAEGETAETIDPSGCPLNLEVQGERDAASEGPRGREMPQERPAGAVEVPVGRGGGRPPDPRTRRADAAAGPPRRSENRAQATFSADDELVEPEEVEPDEEDDESEEDVDSFFASVLASSFLAEPLAEDLPEPLRLSVR